MHKIHWQFLFRSLCVCIRSFKLCPTPGDPMDCSLPGSSVHGILQARILEWIAMPSSRGSSWPRNGTCIMSPAVAGGFFTTSTTCLRSLGECKWWFLLLWEPESCLSSSSAFDDHQLILESRRFTRSFPHMSLCQFLSEPLPSRAPAVLLCK